MLFKRSFLIIILSCIFVSLHAQQIELYAADSIAIGKISEISQGTIGHGLCFSYDLDALPVLGISARVEHAYNLLSGNNSISSWNTFCFSAGVQGLFNITDFMDINPELDVGACVSILRPKTLASNTYTDLLLQLNCAFVFYTPQEENGLSFVITPFYRLLPEQDNLGQYAGINAGIKIAF